MSSEAIYEYNDDGDYLLKIQRCRQHEEDSAYARNVEVSIDGRTCCLPPSQRQAAAQALAGDEYHVVRADPIDDKFIAVQRDEHANLLSELYKARNEVLKLRDHRDRLRQQIIDNANRPFTYDDTCPKCVAGSHITPPAQPDRPEPVDPASVRVGDIVDYETTVEYRLCRIMGEVEDVAEHVTGEDGTSLKIHDKWWNCNIAAVRILQRPEPEPDEAAVEALARALYSELRQRNNMPVNWPELAVDQHKHFCDKARNLIRDHGVHVEVDE